MKNNRLPKSWAVQNDGSQLFKDTVIKYLNDRGSNFNGDIIGCYYGIKKDGYHFTDMYPALFANILTLQEFISLTSEEDIRENEWDFREGDIIKYDNCTRKILAILNDLVFVSQFDFEKASTEFYTKKELYGCGWRIYKEEPIYEMTLEVAVEEIAKLKGVDVSQIRIKDDKKESN
jgi:hypothetical protein